MLGRRDPGFGGSRLRRRQLGNSKLGLGEYSGFRLGRRELWHQAMTEKNRLLQAGADETQWLQARTEGARRILARMEESQRLKAIESATQGVSLVAQGWNRGISAALDCGVCHKLLMVLEYRYLLVRNPSGTPDPCVPASRGLRELRGS